MTTPFLSTEAALAQNTSSIASFWNSMQKGTIPVKKGLHCFYAYAIPKHAKHAVFVCQGRIEAAHKYQELLWELYQNGYAVFTLDHLGQGSSSRLSQDPHLGYIDDFQDYVDCLAQFFAHEAMQPFKDNIIMLAHSMGGAIASLFLAQYPKHCKAAFLSAPMFAIHTHGKPMWLVKYLAMAMCKLGLAKSYAIGQGPYAPIAFELNELSHSQIRYENFRTLYRLHPHLQLGGISYGWLSAALEAMAKIAELTLTLPIHIISAQEDTIVNSKSHPCITARWPNTSVHSVPNAKHELLFEQDVIRTEVMTRFYSFAATICSADTGS